MEWPIKLDQDNGNILKEITRINLVFSHPHFKAITSRAASDCPHKRYALPRKVRTAILSGCICAALQGEEDDNRFLIL